MDKRPQFSMGTYTTLGGKAYTNKPAPPDDSGCRRAVLIAPGLVGVLLVFSGDGATPAMLVLSALGAVLLKDAVSDEQALIATGFGVGVLVNGARATAIERLLGGSLGMLLFAAI